MRKGEVKLLKNHCQADYAGVDFPHVPTWS